MRRILGGSTIMQMFTWALGGGGGVCCPMPCPNLAIKTPLYGILTQITGIYGGHLTASSNGNNHN